MGTDEAWSATGESCRRSCGRRCKQLLLLDNRKPARYAHEPELPIGNVAWNEEYLLSVWRGAPWRRTAVAVFLIGG